MKKLISFTIKSNFGMFKKPDVNDKVFLTYNMIHKPYVIGILGAVMGYGGYAQSGSGSIMPQYYEILKDIRVGISPIDCDGGVFKKEFIVFNNTTNGKTSNITEQTLVDPSYRIFIELDKDNCNHEKLIDSLKKNRAVFLPYMGKNEFPIWWNDFHEHNTFEYINKKERFRIVTLIVKDKDFVLKNCGYKERTTKYFYLFERLPVGLDEQLKQYIYSDFLYTNVVFKVNDTLKNLYESDEGVICLF